MGSYWRTPRTFILPPHRHSRDFPWLSFNKNSNVNKSWNQNFCQEICFSWIMTVNRNIMLGWWFIMVYVKKRLIRWQRLFRIPSLNDKNSRRFKAPFRSWRVQNSNWRLPFAQGHRTPNNCTTSSNVLFQSTKRIQSFSSRSLHEGVINIHRDTQTQLDMLHFMNN